MRKYTVSTSKGFIHTTDFESAKKILQFEFEEKKRKLEEQKKKSQEWDKEFETLLEQYTPKTKEEAMRMKFEGGDV